MMKKILSFLVLVIAVAFVAACDKEGGNMKYSVQSLRSLIETNLAEGDSASEIEAFFSQHGLSLTYNKYKNTYRSMVDSEDGTRTFTIIIHLDDDQRFKNADVRETFTYL